MPRVYPVLSNDQRVRLAEACLSNARDLLRESVNLRHDGALPYAQFLIGCAFEEVLKARYCIEEPAKNWREWWRGFRSHEAKLDMAVRYEPDVPPDAVKWLLELRERCLYVEAKADGDPLTPQGLVDPGGLSIDSLI
jgi:AbiV family abortive infection protein